ncbi:helix-turn-helix transcriptional regulator [Pseudorhodoferax soli]|uniref:HTH luxR-type domain-containing protein n=1 Tax=Pseudorhodoferax soli TaxID=545864 RepID=A0A368XQU3_9BURK|nr:hypothetical protein [Pseudorhodoferax soli]RCW70235.1 hypothetical protein DES41_105176 [Pseudorhodoferax soli]
MLITAGRLGHQPTTTSPAADITSALQGALVSGLDRLAHGVAVVSIDGRIHFANASARALFARLGWAAHGVRAGEHEARWRAALQRCCAFGRRELVEVELPDACLVAALTVVAVEDDNMALVIFGRDEICGSVELQLFALRHALTSAETRILLQLCRGLQASAIAHENGVSRTTVLTQIAAIRSKTRYGSIRSLMDALARMPQLAAFSPVMPSAVQ